MPAIGKSRWPLVFSAEKIEKTKRAEKTHGQRRG